MNEKVDTHINQSETKLKENSNAIDEIRWRWIPLAIFLAALLAYAFGFKFSF